MSQASHRDLEGGNDPANPRADGRPNHPQPTPNQPLQGESTFGDSSGPFFSIYCKAAEEEDNKRVDRWQKDADGILIFTGLFSAAVAALLALTVQDLRPSSQDTSAFYLGNIYGVLADPNTTRATVPSPVAQPPPFSPPRYAVWVNLLWFLSLVISVSCALLATSLNQWMRRYIRLTQPARCTPDKRARMRAFFSTGVDEMHIPWAVEGLPTLLHLALFLFFGGLVIFLFNTNHEVFIGVVWWIGLFSTVYGLMTLLPLIRQDSPYCGPLSTPAWFLYARVLYVTFEVLAYFTNCSRHTYGSWKRYRRMSKRYREWMLGDVEKKVEKNLQKTGSEKPSEIDIHILDWTINTLGDDDSLEMFFEAIPGLFKSKLVKHLERDFPVKLFKSFWGALDGLMDRTLSYNSVTESVKSRRVVICRDIISRIPFPYNYKDDNLRSHFDQAPVSIERLRAMARWQKHKDVYVANSARARVASALASMQERNDDWIGLASDVCGLTMNALRDNIAHARENLFLATLVNVCRRTNRPDESDDPDDIVWEVGPVSALIGFDIHHALPELQHDFCALWNELVQEARKRKSQTPLYILSEIRHLYIALHQGTEALPNSLASSDSINSILDEPSTYPLCLIPGHRSGTIAHLRATSISVVSSTHSSDTSSFGSTPSGSLSSILRREGIAAVIAETPSQSYLTAPGRIGDSSQGRPAATSPALPAHTIPRPPDAPPSGAIAAAPQDIPRTATLSHPLEGTTHQDIVAPCAVPDITASMPEPTPVLALIQASTPPTLDKPLASSDRGAALTPNPLLPTSSVVISSIPSSPLPSRVSPSHNAGFLAPLSGTTFSRPTGNPALPCLRVCGLMNGGNMRFANAVLQLLMHSPPFWNLFNELGDLKRQRGAGSPEIGGGTTPLVDATVRFVEDFTFKEKELPPTQLPQQAAGERLRDDEGEGEKDKVVDSFERTYLYDALKDKKQLKDLLDGQQQDAEEFFRLYLDALDKELAALLASVSGHKATAASGLEEHEVSQSGQTEVGKRGFSQTESVESPLVRIFGGKIRSTVRASKQPDNVTIEDWRSLQLDIQHDSVHAIEDALRRISHLQPVQLGPSSPSAASQQVLIEALPPVLVIHLKRFLYDPAAGGVIKIGKPIQFTPELEIPLEIMAPAAQTASADLAHYKLYGVLYHHGESASSGHYTVDVLHPTADSDSGEAWLHIGDETVSAVRHEDVFGGHDNERVDDRCAYMLFYSRTGPTQT